MDIIVHVIVLPVIEDPDEPNLIDNKSLIGILNFARVADNLNTDFEPE